MNDAASIRMMLDYIQVNSVLAKKASDELDAVRVDREKSAELRPALLQHLLDTKAIKMTQKAAAAEALASHSGTLELLKVAVDMLAAQKQELAKQRINLGAPVSDQAAGVKTASDRYDSLTSPYVGRPTTQTRASDELWRQRVLEH